MKKQILTACAVSAFFGAASFSTAATYIVSNSGGGLTGTNPVINSAGQYLTGDGAFANSTAGSVSFGFFTDETVIDVNNMMPTILSAFVPFGAAETAFVIPEAPLFFRGAFTAQGSVVGAALDEFTGNNIFVVIGNAVNLADSTEAVILKSNATFGSQAQEPINSTIDIRISDLGSSLEMLIGEIGPELPSSTLGSAAALPTFQTVELIPEPSTALVGLLGVGLLALRRRRD